MNYFKNQNCHFFEPVVTMGTFDGVHLGHRKVLEKLTEKAKKRKRKSIVISYFHHPLETIHKKTFPYLLTERKYKEQLIKEFGVDCVLYLDFNLEMAKMPPLEFLREIIIREVGAKSLIIGYDTHFGCERKGNYDFLKKYQKTFDYETILVEPCRIKNKIVSSSLIRDFIREGDMNRAEKFLGRNYFLFGKVKSGERIGRSLGFPTINIKPIDKNKLIPALGVYFCNVNIAGKIYHGISNIGYAPTLKRSQIKEIETHILDFSGDLYQKKVKMCFLKKIRDEKNFSQKEKLIAQIKKDVQKARKYFAKRLEK